MSAPGNKKRVALLWIVIGLCLLFAFKMVGAHELWSYRLDLGSGNFPSPLHLAFMLSYAVLGTATAFFVSLGITRYLAARESKDPADLLQWGSDFRWVAVCTVLALFVPAIIHTFVLHGAPITDDESSYIFSAQLLARGELWSTPHIDKIFFDRSFMVNGDRFYTQYFLGWPALIVPFLLVGAAGFANSVVSALTLPGLYFVTKRVGGPLAARIASLLYLSSPMLMMGASTTMAHTSCMGALVWTAYFALRGRDKDAPLAVHAGLAICFCIAFFIRPLTAVAIGAPLLVYWAMATLKLDRQKLLRRGLSFGLPAIAFGVLFFAINYVQNGAVFKTSYSAALEYARENGFRFTHWTEKTTMSVPLDPSLVMPGISQMGTAILRLNFATFGWPFSFAFVLLALGRAKTLVFWLMFPLFFLCHLTIRNVGVDAFGPVHFFELAFPLILLTAVGLTRLRAAIPRLLPEEFASIAVRAPTVALLVLIALNLICYVPVRLAAFGDRAEVTNMTLNTPSQMGVSNAVVFAPSGFSARCQLPIARGWVYWRPNPDPWFEDDIIWANHITVEVDKRLMPHFPDRKGFVLYFTEACTLNLAPLDEADEDMIEPGQLTGTGIIPPAPPLPAARQYERPDTGARHF